MNDFCKYLISVFDTGLSASTLKFVKSALSFNLKESHGYITNHHLVSRLLRSFEKVRPSVPRYVVTWDVNKVLCFLRNWFPKNGLTLKQLTLNT